MDKGLYGKYEIEKADGSPIDPKSEYFVLRYDIDGEPAARRALLLYADLVASHNPNLAHDLVERIAMIDPELVEEHNAKRDA